MVTSSTAASSASSRARLIAVASLLTGPTTSNPASRRTSSKIMAIAVSSSTTRMRRGEESLFMTGTPAREFSAEDFVGEGQLHDASKAVWRKGSRDGRVELVIEGSLDEGRAEPQSFRRDD